MKKVIALLLTMLLIAGGFGSQDYAQASLGNSVSVDFSTAYRYIADGDLVVSVPNSLLAASFMEASAGIMNEGDNYPDSVVYPVLTFTPAVDDIQVSGQYLVSDSPPYTWNLPTLYEQPSLDQIQGARIFATTTAEPFTFTPGFTTSRTLSQIEFVGPGTFTQQLDISTTIEEAGFTGLVILVIVNDDVVDAIITGVSVVSGDGDVSLWPDSRTASIRIENPTVGTTYNQRVLIAITLETGVDNASFKPRIHVDAMSDTAAGEISGDGVSGITELGTWEWTTTDSYSWHWVEGLVKSVVFPAVQGGSEPANEVQVHFATDYEYWVPGDSFTNAQVMGRKVWMSALTRKDAMSPVANVSLTLDSTLEFDWIEPEPFTMGPPIEWRFGDVAPESDVGADVGPGSQVFFTPGFDASRSVDKTIFKATDNQTLTITVTPKQMMPELNINVVVPDDQNVFSTIISPTTDEAQGIWLSDDGRQLHIDIENPEVGTPYTYQVTIHVSPLVAEIEFMPHFNIGWGGPVDSGTATGSSLSRTEAELGTWTWSTQDSYLWQWSENLQRSVNFEGYSRPLANEVVVLFHAFSTYLSPEDTFANGEVDGVQSWQAQIINAKDNSGEVVANAMLSLVSKRIFDRVVPPPLTMGATLYQWSYGNVAEWETYLAVVGFIPPDSAPFTPGFDVSRSFDRTRFSELDTQTVTITVTPRQDGLALFIVDVFAFEDDKVASEITGHSDADPAAMDGAGHHLLLVKQAPVNGEEYSFTVTIKVRPKVAQVEFVPTVRVYAPTFDTNEETTGSSVSYTMEGVGDWTWSAEGSYQWTLLAGTAKAVAFPRQSTTIIESFSIGNMSVDFDNRPSHDKIAVTEATLLLGEDAGYDLAVDDVILDIDGVVITIPAGSFVQGKGGDYVFKTPKGVEPKVEMKLNFDKGEWSFKVDRIDASAIDNYDGVDITLTIGAMSATERINMRVGGLTYIAGQ